MKTAATPDAADSRTDLDHEHRDHRVSAELERPGSPDDPSTSRRQQAETLAARARGDRQPLEELRRGFLRRLNRASDDFDATEGLRTVEMALSMTPRTMTDGHERRREL